MDATSTEERLVYMANQIAANFAIAGRDAAAAATADHIATFWDPRMRRRIIARLDGRADGDVDAAGGLGAIAGRAIAMLRDRGAPSPQTLATTFSAVDQPGGSDAG